MELEIIESKDKLSHEQTIFPASSVILC